MSVGIINDVFRENVRAAAAAVDDDADANAAVDVYKHTITDTLILVKA